MLIARALTTSFFSYVDEPGSTSDHQTSKALFLTHNTGHGQNYPQRVCTKTLRLKSKMFSKKTISSVYIIHIP